MSERERESRTERKSERDCVFTCVCVCMCVCVTPHLLIDRGAIRGDIHGFDAEEYGKYVDVRDA